MPLAVALSSCVRNMTSVEGVGFRIVDGGILAASKQKIELAARKGVNGGLIDLKWIPGGEDLLPDLDGFVFKNTKFNKTNLFRLSMESIVDEDCEIAVFLDGDIVVLDDVNQLVDELTDADFAAVRDFGMPRFSNRFKGEIPEWIGADPQNKYFNAGIFVTRIAAWREQEWSSQLIQMFQEHADECRWLDQDCLNFFLSNRWKEVSLTWNVQTGAPDRLRRVGGDEQQYLGEPYEQIRSRAQILHFTGVKPWDQGFSNKSRGDWVVALAESGWFSSICLRLWQIGWWARLGSRALKLTVGKIIRQ